MRTSCLAVVLLLLSCGPEQGDEESSDTSTETSTLALAQDLAVAMAQNRAVTPAAFTSALAVERDQPSRPLSEPGRIASLAWTYLLGKDSSSFSTDAFVATLVTRLAYLSEFGEATSTPNRAGKIGSTLSSAEVKTILVTLQNGTRTTFGARTRNNRELREAAALNLVRVVLSDLKRRGLNPSFEGFATTSLIQSGPFATECARAIAIAFNPLDGVASSSYALTTSDGAYKEGAGYLRFTAQVLVPMLFMLRALEQKNLLTADHEFGAGTSARLRAMFQWLLWSQSLDGRWNTTDDNPHIDRGWMLEPELLWSLFEGSPVDSIRIANRANRALALEAICRSWGPGSSPTLASAQANCTADCRRSGLNVALCGTACQAEHDLAAVVTLDHTSLATTIQGVDCAATLAGRAPRVALYPTGGQFFSRSEAGVEAKLFNQGNFYVGAGSCPTLPLGDFGPLGNLQYRGCNHNRTDDQHLDLRIAGFNLVAGSGQMGYDTAKAYAAWNQPSHFSSPSIGNTYAKVVYQGNDGTGTNLTATELQPGVRLLTAPGDVVTRYVLSVREQYFLVADVRQPSAGPAPIVSTYQLRSTQVGCNQGQCWAPFTEQPLLTPATADVVPTPTLGGLEVGAAVSAPNVGVVVRQLSNGTMNLTRGAATCNDGISLALGRTQTAKLRFCEVTTLRQTNPGLLSATLLWPSKTGNTPPLIKVAPWAGGTAPLLVTVGTEHWRLQVTPGSRRTTLQVARGP